MQHSRKGEGADFLSGFCYGYDLSFNMGYQLGKLQMEDRSRKAEDIDYSLFFIRLIAGLRLAEAR